MVPKLSAPIIIIKPPSSSLYSIFEISISSTMNTALDFAFPAKPSFVGGRTRRVIPSPRLFGSCVRVCSLPPPSSSLKVNIYLLLLRCMFHSFGKLNRITKVTNIISNFKLLTSELNADSKCHLFDDDDDYEY